jgi:phosphodiesterase/alkaline phosphatase D-like protein
VTTSSFTANWRTVSAATGYRLDVSANKSFSSYVPGYQNLDVGNTTSYNVTGLSPNTTYFYRLRAYNGNGTSPNSNVVRVKTRRL